jgi:hypothetical protein
LIVENFSYIIARYKGILPRRRGSITLVKWTGSS